MSTVFFAQIRTNKHLLTYLQACQATVQGVHKVPVSLQIAIAKKSQNVEHYSFCRLYITSTLHSEHIFEFARSL